VTFDDSVYAIRVRAKDGRAEVVQG